MEGSAESDSVVICHWMGGCRCTSVTQRAWNSVHLARRLLHLLDPQRERLFVSAIRGLGPGACLLRFDTIRASLHVACRYPRGSQLPLQTALVIVIQPGRPPSLSQSRGGGQLDWHLTPRWQGPVREDDNGGFTRAYTWGDVYV